MLQGWFCSLYISHRCRHQQSLRSLPAVVIREICSSRQLYRGGSASFDRCGLRLSPALPALFQRAGPRRTSPALSTRRREAQNRPRHQRYLVFVGAGLDVQLWPRAITRDFMGAGHSLTDADAADTTTTTDAPPSLPKAAKKTAAEPQQPSGRTLRSSTRAQIAAALAEALVSPPPPPPPRRALKLDSTGETVESAADAAAKPSSLLRQPKLPVVTHRSSRRPDGSAYAANRRKRRRRSAS